MTSSDEYILIPYKENALTKKEVITLSETAAVIYQESKKASSVKELAQRIANIYEVNLDVVYEDVKEVISTLIEKGVLLDE